MYSYNPYYANYLAHFGIKGKSGRYPYGSGDRPYQHDPHAKKRYKAELKADRKKAKILTGTASYAADKFRDSAINAMYYSYKSDKYNTKLRNKAYANKRISDKELLKANNKAVKAINYTKYAEESGNKYLEKKKELEKFHKEMIKKYGKENVKDIPMKNFQLVDPVTKQAKTVNMVRTKAPLGSTLISAGFGFIAGLPTTSVPAFAGLILAGGAAGASYDSVRRHKYAKYL